METQTRLSRHNKFISAEGLTYYMLERLRNRSGINLLVSPFKFCVLLVVSPTWQVCISKQTKIV